MTDTSPDLVDARAEAAGDAARRFAATTGDERAQLLDRIADRLDQAGARLVPVAERETHLALPRLRTELARTTYQLRAFARAVAERRHLRPVLAPADADYPLGGPSPDLRSVAYPVGPVAVFAASNFPFAFSVAGGDTASALAAGCPVVVKAHPGHPELSRLVAAELVGVVAEAGLPRGVFALIEGVDAGARLLRHPRIRAAAFTGSTRGGRALFDIAASRPDPIPFYGELGSINPVYVTREAVAEGAGALAEAFVSSYTLGAGQFCTKPGLVFVPSGTDFVERAAARVDDVEASQLLDERIRAGFESLEDVFTGTPGVDVVRAGASDESGARPALYRTDFATLLAHTDDLTQERFGPSALVVEYDDPSNLTTAARIVEGTLTSTIHARTPGDAGVADLVDEIRPRSGRLIWNGWPTGVTVSAAMMHGGPYPASTSSLHTSVGLGAIERFLRPVAYQDFPEELLPPELRTPPAGNVADGAGAEAWHPDATKGRR